MPTNIVRSFCQQSATSRWASFWGLVESIFLQTELYLAEATFHTESQIDAQKSRLEDIISQLASLTDSISPESLAPWRNHAASLHARLSSTRATVSQTSNPVLIVQSSTVIGSAGGRPRITINLPDVLENVNQGYRLNEIVKESNFSRSTLYRRRAEAKQLHRQTFTDDEIDSLVCAVLEEHPSSGYRAVVSSIRSEGISVTEERVRKSLARVDPTRRIQSRVRHLPTRIPYFVPGPNCVWHFDGHHKLIRWGFITHGAIDGFSRRIMWLQVRTNNYAQTVLECFKEAILKFGIPKKTRCDKGGENVLVVEEMMRLHPESARPALTGKSTQNTRIERLWYDHGIKALDSFCSYWDYHPVRTAASKTPIRMWNDGWASRESAPIFPDDDANYASERLPALDDAADEQVHLEDPLELGISRESLETWAVLYGAQEPGDEAGVKAYFRLRSRILEEFAM